MSTETPKGRVRKPASSRSRTRLRKAEHETAPGGNGKPGQGFPVVGVGASAGGLTAFQQLLESVPHGFPAAFILVPHLEPRSENLLPDLISKGTDIPVVQAQEGMAVRPGHVYLMPPNHEMTIRNRILHLHPRNRSRDPHRPIDTFMRSLAEDQKTHAIGIVLSGSGSDGTLGLTAVKAEGGITFAQDESSARHRGMPRSALSAGVVDFVFPPEQIAAQLARFACDPYLRSDACDAIDLHSDTEAIFTHLYQRVRSATGVDFSKYDRSMVQGRVKRRMVLLGLDRVKDYLDHIRENPYELIALHDEVLTNLPLFFRDPEVLDALKSFALATMVGDRSRKRPIRAWVPGCSTGAEAYSIAICLLETYEAFSPGPGFQVFGTDISESAIDRARAGVYPESIASDVTPDRLRRFFNRVEEGYRVSKVVRESCVFAKHDLTRDAPFSRLDIICCRNVLSQFGSTLQRRILPLFHQALEPGGYLLVGGFETIDIVPELFTPVEAKHKIYVRGAMEGTAWADVPQAGSRSSPLGVSSPKRRLSRGTASEEADRIVLARYGPPAVIVDQDLEVLQFRGKTGSFLEPATGHASLNLLRMARPGLVLPLREVIRTARRTREAVKKENVRFELDGREQFTHIEVIPLSREDGHSHHLVLFGDAPDPASRRKETLPVRSLKNRAGEEVRALRAELGRTRDYLKSVVAAQEASNEELQIANEEILSSNEELQLTNEELSTSKEELQSTNEELSVVNEELHNRNDELDALNRTLQNILKNLGVPILILDPELRIRRFNTPSEALLKVTPSDIGRSLADIDSKVGVRDLEKLALEVMETGQTESREVCDSQGSWFSVRTTASYAGDGTIDGVVMAIIDINDLRQGLKRLQESQEYAQAIVETMNEALLVLDEDLTVRAANSTFYGIFGATPDRVRGAHIISVLGGGPNLTPLIERLEDLLERRIDAVEGLQLEMGLPAPSKRTLRFDVRPLFGETGRPRRLLLVARDITRVVLAEKMVEELSGRLLHVRDEEQRHIARELHDTTAQNLTALGANLAVVERSADHLPESARRFLAECIGLVRQCSTEVRDLAFLLHPPLLDEAGLPTALKWFVDSYERRTRISVRLDLPDEFERMPADCEISLFRVVQEALNNVFRHSGCKKATVRLYKRDGEIHAEIKDQGIGMNPDRSERGSMGIGVPGMRQRMRHLGGSFDILSDREGTTVKASVPLAACDPNEEHPGVGGRFGVPPVANEAREEPS